MLPKIATTYLDIYCRTAGMSRQAVLSWLPCVAAAKLAEGVPRELDDFLKIVDTFLLNFTHPITSAADARPPSSSDRNCRLAPPGLAQTVEHVGLVFGPHPRYALTDIHVESARGDGDGLFEHFFGVGSATKLAERGSQPAVRPGKIRKCANSLLCRLGRGFIFS